MNEPEELQDELYLRENYRTEPIPSEFGGNSETTRSFDGREAATRVVGSPLPMGSSPITSQETHGHKPATPVGRTLSTVGTDETSAIMQRAMGVLKQAMPFVQRLLPLIDGNFATAVSNVLTARPHPPAPAPNVDLTPVQNQISELQSQHNELRSTVQEQTTGLKRVEDQLEMVREATDRNTLEQQELIEDLKAMGGKVNMFALLLSSLLVLSVVLNVVLYLHIKRVLP